MRCPGRRSSCRPGRPAADPFRRNTLLHAPLRVKVVQHQLPHSAAHVGQAETIAAFFAIMVYRRDKRKPIAPGRLRQRPGLFPAGRKSMAEMFSLPLCSKRFGSLNTPVFSSTSTRCQQCLESQFAFSRCELLLGCPLIQVPRVAADDRPDVQEVKNRDVALLNLPAPGDRLTVKDASRNSAFPAAASREPIFSDNSSV